MQEIKNILLFQLEPVIWSVKSKKIILCEKNVEWAQNINWENIVCLQKKKKSVLKISIQNSSHFFIWIQIIIDIISYQEIHNYLCPQARLGNFQIIFTMLS